jgi:hypothetical protein
MGITPCPASFNMSSSFGRRQFRQKHLDQRPDVEILSEAQAEVQQQKRQHFTDHSFHAHLPQFNQSTQNT